ncbi:MAG: dihydropteroate synthase [Planctomycetes bacterium]|nr:dihydropteroate synthase [Planctomycetota bacterium]MCH9726443.1 dihydropteroate synthase [Planctomycetota bacterium]MCH9778252.1 dihydropteroate synthase [Planctomycetota bacterium]
MKQERILFVTGKLAEYSLREILEKLAPQVNFTYEITILNVQVAALMHVPLVKRRLNVPEGIDWVMLPGLCKGDLQILTDHFGLPFKRGPKDHFDLPEYFGQAGRPPKDLSQFDIEILAEINHAPFLSNEEILRQAEHYRQNGADLIDVGCVPGESWNRAGDVVQMLVDAGHRVSIDSFEQKEVEAAVSSGAELILSCNHSNIDWVSKLGIEVVAIPDLPSDFDSLRAIVDQLVRSDTPFRIDPILEPIGFGFTASIERYYRTRKEFPEFEIMMGIGNLTELTEVDTAGINFVLAALCQELKIHSILATEVINWAQSAIREFDYARRLVKFSIDNKSLPKHIHYQLVMLRDARLNEMGQGALNHLAQQIRDPNYRIFAEQDELHVMNRDGYWKGTDPFELFDQFEAANPKELDPSHAFYLGYEMCKAMTALTLGKQYQQDQPLNWGFLSQEEISAQERRRLQGEDPQCGPR